MFISSERVISEKCLEKETINTHKNSQIFLKILFVYQFVTDPVNALDKGMYGYNGIKDSISTKCGIITQW